MRASGHFLHDARRMLPHSEQHVTVFAKMARMPPGGLAGRFPPFPNARKPGALRGINRV
jgi:hypothetical protein